MLQEFFVGQHKRVLKIHRLYATAKDSITAKPSFFNSYGSPSQ